MEKKVSIVLIDDNATDLFLHERFIFFEGIATKVVSFNLAEKALEYLTSNDGIDVIVLDIQMPLMNGFDFLRAYERNALSKKCPVVMVSSTLDFGDISRAKANPMVLDLLEKPLNMTSFVEILKKNNLL
jgi:DNA-binding NtrC family response regulator